MSSSSSTVPSTSTHAALDAVPSTSASASHHNAKRRTEQELEAAFRRCTRNVKNEIQFLSYPTETGPSQISHGTIMLLPLRPGVNLAYASEPIFPKASTARKPKHRKAVVKMAFEDDVVGWLTTYGSHAKRVRNGVNEANRTLKEHQDLLDAFSKAAGLPLVPVNYFATPEEQLEAIARGRGARIMYFPFTIGTQHGCLLRWSHDGPPQCTVVPPKFGTAPLAKRAACMSALNDKFLEYLRYPPPDHPIASGSAASTPPIPDSVPNLVLPSDGSAPQSEADNNVSETSATSSATTSWRHRPRKDLFKGKTRSTAVAAMKAKWKQDHVRDWMEECNIGALPRLRRDGETELLQEHAHVLTSWPEVF